MPQELDPKDNDNFSKAQKAVISELKEWPRILVGLFQSPTKTISELPISGSWTRPLIFSGISGVVSGLVSAFYMIRFFPASAPAAFIQSVVSFIVTAFVGGAILNFILSIFGKDPKIYRSIFLVGILTGLSAIGYLVSRFTFFSWYAVSAANIFVIYHYAQVAGGFSKKQAVILIAIMGAVTVMSIGGLMMGLGLLYNGPAF